MNNDLKGIRWLDVSRVQARTIRSTAAWTIKPKYRYSDYAKRRAANLSASRDFVIGRNGKMGDDMVHGIGTL